MAVPTGRTQRRIRKEIVVELARPDAAGPKETATTENASDRGMRVVTEHVWRAGDPVLVSSPTTGLETHARVVYCQRFGNKGFAVGLELSEPTTGWTKLD